MAHPAGDPEIPVFTLPDGTTHDRLYFAELLAHEQEQGGYWLWQGEEKIFVRVISPVHFTVRHYIRKHRLLHRYEPDGKPGSITQCKTVACKTALWRLGLERGVRSAA